MPIHSDSVQRLCESIDAIVAFARENGVEYRYEIQRDLSRVRTPLTTEQKRGFAKLDGALMAGLNECGIAAFHDLHQPIEGGFEFGRSKLRCVDTDGGPAIVYSDKWLVYLQCLREEAEIMLERTTQIDRGRCRLSVIVDRLHTANSYLVFNGAKLAVELEIALFIQELIHAGRGVYRSSTEMCEANTDLPDCDFRVDRLKKRLKRDFPDVARLIESSGRGSKLTDSAWLA